MNIEQTKSSEELVALGQFIITFLNESGGNEVDKYIILRGLFEGLKATLKSKGIIIIEDDIVGKQK